MSFINLVVRFPQSGNSYALKFNRNLTVADLCTEINSKISECDGNPSDYGLFVTDPDPKHSFWLDHSRILSYYHFCENFEVEYRYKMRLLVIQTMDGTRKTLQVDDSKTVAELLNTICSKMGVTNYDEYSLIRPMDEEEKMRTLTLRRNKGVARDQNKLEKMKQKLHTDDELNWLAPGKTLRQQGVEESDVIILRRKFFFSDQNVDTRDPVQLNLLFVQLKEAILNGTHPISLEQAIQLAALQCQAEIGVLTDEKAKRYSVDLKEHLPKEYWKTKGVERRIQEAHRKVGKFGDRESKLQYVQLCRSLPTYGITFFLIKEKLQGRNKLVPRLFGVCKESVMRVDENTKEILETWPMTHIRRWSVGSNLFILDFGMYSQDGHYVIQTTEAERIGQLLSGYIDIMLRRQKGKQASLAEHDEESTIVEENVAPSRANVISNLSDTLSRGHLTEETHVAHSGTLRTASQRGGYSEGHLATRGHTVEQQNLSGAYVGSGRIISRNGVVNGTDGHDFQVIDLGQPKRALLSRIDFGLRTIQEAAEDIEVPVYSDNETLLGEDTSTKRWRSDALEQARNGMFSHLGAMTMAAGQLISCLNSTSTRPDREAGDVDFDYSSMDASLVSIGVNVNGLIQCVRLFDQIDSANGADDRGQDLKQAAQMLSDAFLDLLRATVPKDSPGKGSRRDSLSRSSCSLSDPVGNGPDRVALLEAAGRVGDASQHLMQLIFQNPVSVMNARVEKMEPGDADDVSPYHSSLQVVDWEARDRLLSATKAVAHRMAELVKLAKAGAMRLGQEAADVSSNGSTELHLDAVSVLKAAQSNLIQAATTAGKSASQLVTCAKVVVCTMEQPESQDQLIRAAKLVSVSANGITEAIDDLIRSSIDTAESDVSLHESHLQLGDSLHDGVLSVHSNLDTLVACLKATTIQAHQDPVVTTLLSAATQLPASVGDGLSLAGKATSLASAASHLVNDLRTEAALSHSQTGLSSVEADRRADLLESQIRHLLTVTEDCANGNVQSLEHQRMVVAAAEQLVAAAHATAAPIIRARLAQGLEFATRLTASNAGPLVTVGGEVIRICQTNTHELTLVLEHLQKQIIPQVNLSCAGARTEPYDKQKQSNLLLASQNLMQCLEDLLRLTDAVVPTVPDSGVQGAFSGAARNTQACLTDLRLCYDNSEHILGCDPPALETIVTTDPSFGAQHDAYTMALSKSNHILESLDSELRSTTSRLLPDETLDSVSVALWNAVSRFNRAFPVRDPRESYRESQVPNQLPTLVACIVPSVHDLSPANRNYSQIISVVDELLERLAPVIQGIRGLAAFFAMTAQSQAVDPHLARILLVSHGISCNRQSSISTNSTRGSMYSPREDHAQSTAGSMAENLLSIGESCIVDVSRLIHWALQSDRADVLFHDLPQMVTAADQISTSINASLGYVPGEVIVRRLFALLKESNTVLVDTSILPQELLRASTSVEISDNVPKSPGPQVFTRVPSQELQTRMAASARRLARICLEASDQLSSSVHATQSNEARKSFIGFDSKLVVLAHLADRITDALTDVIRASSGRLGKLTNTDDLLRIGTPVAAGLRHAMRTLTSDTRSSERDHDSIAPDIPLPQALLQLRDWALEVSLLADAKPAPVVPSTGTPSQPVWTEVIPDSQENVVLVQMRNQCDAAARRVNILLRQSSSQDEEGPDKSPSISAGLCTIRLPVSSHTFPACLDSINHIDEEIKRYMETIPSAAAKRDADSFCSAVKSVAQATCQMLQSAYQAAYLIGAAHPSSKPGHVGRFAGSEQLTALHDHIAAIRKGASDLSQTGVTATTPDGLPSLELMNIATNLAQRATQLCQSTRPLLSDCKNSSEKKTLAESLERVARTAAAVFRSTQLESSSDSASMLQQLKTRATQLEEEVDQYADVLIRAAGGSPAQLAEETSALQAPILNSSQLIAESSSQLLETSKRLVVTVQAERVEANEAYTSSGRRLSEAIAKLTSLLTNMAPGIDACRTTQANVVRLLTEVDDVLLAVTSASQPGVKTIPATRIESSLGLIRSSVQQIEQLSRDAVDNWRRGHWELLSHDVHSISNYLPSLIKECVQSTLGLSRVSEQTALLSLARTVLEAVQQLLDYFVGELHRIQSSPWDSKTLSVPDDRSSVLKQACKDLLSRVDTIAKIQGGLSWHISSINAACLKLDDVNSFRAGGPNKSTDPTGFVQAHTRLGHQSHALADAAVRVMQTSSTADSMDSTAVANAVALFAQLFVHMTETVQTLSSILLNQTRSESGPAVAHRLCHVTQAVGAACSDFLRVPLHTEQFKVFSSRLDDLKAVLQSCAPGADACATAATNIGRLVADLDTAALFVRAGTLADPASSSAPESPHPPSGSQLNQAAVAAKQRAFQAAQEAVMLAAKRIVEDMRSMVKNTSSDQNALAISAQNCLLRSTELTESVKSAASRAANVPLTLETTSDCCTESQVQLLMVARDVVNSMVQLLNHGKSVAATRYAIVTWGESAMDETATLAFSSRQKALNDGAVLVVERISELSRILQSLSSHLSLNKWSPANLPQPSQPAPPVLLKRSKPAASSSDSDPERANIRTGLQSVADVIKQFEERISSWSIANGVLQRPASDCDFESEQHSALGLKTEPQQLVTASRAITQAAIKANNATGSGQLSEIGVAGHLLRRSAEDLLRILPLACQSALSSASTNGSRKNSVVDEDVCVAEDEDDKMSLANVQVACSRAITGTSNTLSELQQLITHMIESLSTGPSSPASMQVTLAMRRLRETVFEIVESAMGMPGAKGEVEPLASVTPKPIPVTRLAPKITPKPLHRHSSLLTSSRYQAEVEQSIADANATASDVVSVPLQKELTDMTGELERNVHRIGQLHSKRGLGARSSVRFSGGVTSGESSGKQDVSDSHRSDPPDSCTNGRSIVDSNEGLDAIIASCQHVVHTTLGLMYWAAAAQRELVQQGRLKPIELDPNGTSESESQWSQGLISAARYVASGANYVVESARSMVAARVSALDRNETYSAVHGTKPDALISAAQTTAGCTAQLVVACIAKADPSSKSCTGLRQAGAGVKRATDNLVRLVQSYYSNGCSTDSTGQWSDGLNTSVVASMRQVIETKSNIAAKQRELEKLHTQLKHIHQDQYKSHLS